MSQPDIGSGMCVIIILSYSIRNVKTLQTWKHIFTSPSSALKNTSESGRIKSGQAKINNLEHVTGRTIAYAAVQVSFNFI